MSAWFRFTRANLSALLDICQCPTTVFIVSIFTARSSSGIQRLISLLSPAELVRTQPAGEQELARQPHEGVLQPAAQVHGDPHRRPLSGRRHLASLCSYFVEVEKYQDKQREVEAMHQGQASLKFIRRGAFSCQPWRTHLQTVGQPFMKVGEFGSDDLGPGETPQKGKSVVHTAQWRPQ